ncbi:MAG: HAD-IIA family hydrolase [Kiritimatiellae bacterium]|jgi:NagD protein|nr:HAD-IIA family hydrolase [Kiritimatiellia bacterium]
MNIQELRDKQGFISDMDGVIYHGNRLIPGAQELVAWLESSAKKYIFLTNSSQRSPRELSQKLDRLGIHVGEEHFYTSAMATAAFLQSQCPGGSAYVIGEPALTNALYEAGFTMNDNNPDYVVVGETSNYTYDRICFAVSLVNKGSRLIGTNPDTTGPVESGIVPATGALMAPIEMATGAKAYYVGKPNPIMMRSALKMVECRREDTIIIGDRMDTDIIAGVEAGMKTVLVQTGVTTPESMRQFAYRPSLVLQSIAEIPG